MKDEMLKSQFGIEIEMTGITRSQAAEVVARTIGGTIEYVGAGYDKRTIKQQDGRKWTIMSDGSIRTKKKTNGRTMQDTTQL